MAPLSGPAKRATRDALIRATYVAGVSGVRRRVLNSRRGPLSRVLDFHPIESAKSFDRMLASLAENFNFVSLAQIEDQAGLSDTRTNLAITFDDGFTNQVQNAVPVLKKWGFPATFFLPAGALNLSADRARLFYGERVGIAYEQSLTSEAVKRLASEPGIEIGLHGWDHADLGVCNSADDLAREVVRARQEVEEIANKEVVRFAYPFGDVVNYTPGVIEFLESAGLRSAYTIVPGFNTAGTPRYELHRDSLHPDMGGLLVRAWLNGAYDPFKAIVNSTKARSR
jgi:peptidoglycan/xylan/chitin deacetylase (PgdA/CDA1 family)